MLFKKILQLFFFALFSFNLIKLFLQDMIFFLSNKSVRLEIIKRGKIEN